MSEKESILNAWIMVEHLSEGDIDTSKRDRKHRLSKMHDHDYHAFMMNQFQQDHVKEKGGLVLYIDIFPFDDVISLLRTRYNLEQSYSEVKTGEKFSYALSFVKDGSRISYVEDSLFFTESAFIRYYGKIPDEKQFRDFEDQLKKDMNESFAWEEDPEEKLTEEEKQRRYVEHFNHAVAQALALHSASAEKCILQSVDNLETDAANLHSFYIDDLEKAKTIDVNDTAENSHPACPNLHAYLFGNAGRRYDLDAQKDSGKFNPAVFERILQPENYPLGRYPSNPEYSLSLMQQTAVNLAAGADTSQMRSVNGPPGTGKSTLLYDIFAQLVVQQAADICNLSRKHIQGTEESVYYKQARIGILPEQIAENNIVVASSNNGAVQNIVNELPLCEKVDPQFLDELKEADYFRELANSSVKEVSEKSDDGKKHARSVMTPNADHNEKWGLFSLEGGKSANMNNIRNRIESIVDELNGKEFVPDPDAYQKFLDQYNALKAYREEVQTAAERYDERKRKQKKLGQLQNQYEADLRLMKAETDEEKNRIAAEKEKAEKEVKRLEQQREALRAEEDSVKESLARYETLAVQMKPGRLHFFSSSTAKAEYREKKEKYNGILSKCKDLTDELEAYRQKTEVLEKKEKMMQKQHEELEEQDRKNLDRISAWKKESEDEIRSLQTSLEQIRDTDDLKPLNLNMPYDELQLSNPWFDEEYRIRQSRLFISALRVRKQFLFENRRNVKAAINIWNNQKKHASEGRYDLIAAAWNWMNFTIPVIGSTFASFHRMCRFLEPNTIGHLFVDEAGQALPQAAVGTIFRSRHFMAVGDPSQIKPVLTLDPAVLGLLSRHYGVSENYLSDSASVQTLTDDASQYGFYKEQDASPESWIGIPLWVHRRCRYPMFTISNTISYGGFMVQGMKKDGRAYWYDIGGKASDKYVREQSDFLVKQIEGLMKQNGPEVRNSIYVISPFRNVAHKLAADLEKIHFTRKDRGGRPVNVGTIHTFQGKEAPIVFLVLGADEQSAGAASWAVSEANMMNVAATRAKKEFYIIGDKKLYRNTGSPVVQETIKAIDAFNQAHPDLKYEMPDAQKEMSDNAVHADHLPQEAAADQKTGIIIQVRRGRTALYAYVTGDDGKRYTLNEKHYQKLSDEAKKRIVEKKRIVFTVEPDRNTNIKDIIL